MREVEVALRRWVAREGRDEAKLLRVREEGEEVR